MKSLKSHISLITALFAILIILQLFLSLERIMNVYEHNLSDNYGIVVVCDTNLSQQYFTRIDPLILHADALSPVQVLQSLQKNAGEQDLKLMALKLPFFYRLKLKHFITPERTRILADTLLDDPAISRVEAFARQHDTVYRLLSLFKGVIAALAAVLFLVTSLLIIKEMRLWQFQHRERMNIMALFGAPVWLRSAVLFRLAIVDAVIATLLSGSAFFAMEQYGWADQLRQIILVDTTLFIPLTDLPWLLGLSVTLSILLATVIIMGHKEEV